MQRAIIKIQTFHGYELLCSSEDLFMSNQGWKKACFWGIGDKISIQREQNQWGQGIDLSTWKRPIKRKSRKDLPRDYYPSVDDLYLMGLFLAEGNVTSGVSGRNNCICITNQDLGSYLISKGFTDCDGIHFTYCSEELISFYEWMGMKWGAKNKIFPKRVLQMPKEYIAACLSGYFDGDGCATKRGTIHCDSSSEQLIKDIQSVLLNFGIIAHKSRATTKPTKRVRKSCICHRLELLRSGSCIFFEAIKFRIPRKQERQSNIPDRFSQGDSDLIPISQDWANAYLSGMNMGWIKRQKAISYKTAKELLLQKHDDWLEEIVSLNFYFDDIKSIDYSSI